MGNQWVTACSGAVGPTGLARPERIAPLGLQTDLRLRARGPEKQQQGDDYRWQGELPSNGTTKQTQFLITDIDPGAYK